LADTYFPDLISGSSTDGYTINTDVLSKIEDSELEKWKLWTLRNWNEQPAALSVTPLASTQSAAPAKSPVETTPKSITLDPIPSTSSSSSISNTIPY
jgi:hypothetical protein